MNSRLLGVLAMALGCAGAVWGQEVRLPAPGAPGWRPLELPKVKRMTRFTPLEVDGRAAVKAESDCSASALIYPTPDIDLARTPRLQWQWKVEQGLAAHDERVKAGDDFAARVYVLFRFDPAHASLWERARHRIGTQLYGDDLPGDALNYVWSSVEPAGSQWDNPFVASSKMIARGHGQRLDWGTETVDVAADYLAIFGHQPPPVLGVALMTDADNTCQRAVAYFADVRFLAP